MVDYASGDGEGSAMQKLLCYHAGNVMVWAQRYWSCRYPWNSQWATIHWWSFVLPFLRQMDKKNATFQDDNARPAFFNASVITKTSSVHTQLVLASDSLYLWRFLHCSEWPFLFSTFPRRNSLMNSFLNTYFFLSCSGCLTVWYAVFEHRFENKDFTHNWVSWSITFLPVRKIHQKLQCIYIVIRTYI